MNAGNKKCPICKLQITHKDLHTNMVLRDTIERLYPHVLRKRAVEDIQVITCVCLCLFVC